MSKVKVSNGTDTYEIDGNDLPSAVKDGFKPTERIIVSNSKTKESYEIDPNDVKSALDEGFSFSDIVKKNGASGKSSQPQQSKEPESPQLNKSETEAITPVTPSSTEPEKDLLTLSKERKTIKESQVSGQGYGYGGAPVSQDIIDSRKKELENINQKIKDAGGDEALANDIEDLPQGEGFSFVKNIPDLIKLRQDNKYAYNQELASMKSKGELFNAIKNKSDLKNANELISGLQTLETQDFRDATKQGISLVRQYVDNGDEQNKIIKNLISSKAYDYGIQPIDQEWMTKYPNLNPYQARYMRFLEDTDPATFQAYSSILSQNPDDQTFLGSKENDIRRGYEMKAKEAENAGMNIQMKAIEQRLTDLKNKNDNGQKLTPEEQQEYDQRLAEYQTLAKDKETQNQRYPTQAVVDADQLMQESLGSKNSIPKKFALGVGEQFDNAVNWMGDLLQDKGVRGDLELLGDKQLSGLGQYKTENEKIIGSDFVATFDPELQKQIDEVKNSDVSDEQKQDKVRELILNNQDKVSYVANDKSGKANFTSKAVLNTVSDVAKSLVSQLAIAYMSGGGSATTKIGELTHLFGSTFATTYNDYYNEGLQRNMAHPSQYALVNTTIEAASELINNDFEVARKLMGKGTTLAKVLEHATKEEWEAVAKKSAFSKVKSAMLETGKTAFENAIQETKEEVAGQLASNISDKQIFNQETGVGKDIGSTIVQTFVGMLPLGLISLPFNYHNINRNQKYAMYEAGMNPNKFIEAIDKGLAEGLMTPQEAKEKKEYIQRAAQAVQSASSIRLDGTPMTDNEKTEYAFNQSVLQEIKEQKKDATPEIKEKLEKEEEKLNAAQTELIKPKKQTKKIKLEQNQEKQKSVPVSENIVPNKEYQTMNMGKDEGKPETKEARTQMKERMLDGNIPMDGEGGKGETGKQFASRVLTEWEKTKNEEANNSTLVTHSSVLKAIKTWENPETWKRTQKPVNPAEMNDEQWKQFAEQFNKESTDNGDLETFKGKNGDIHVIRHGQTEDNKLNKFRSGNTNLTDEGIQQAHEVGQELKDKTNGEVPKIITSDLPRAVHTSNIIHENLKSNENASAIRSDTRQVQETGNAVEGSQNKSGENIQSPERQTSVDAKTEQQARAKIEINTPEDFERELNKIFSNEPETKTESQKTEPKKEKQKATPTKEKAAKPTLSKKEQEMADYAYKNSYPYFKKEYPGIDVDEYNRLRSVKRQQGLPKLGEINQEDNVRPRNEDTSQYTPQSILDKAKAFYKNDPLINKVISFLEPIVKANPNIKIDTDFKWDSPEYQGQKITNQALGYSFPSGDIILNFDKIRNYDTLYRTGLHELMHAATRNEINTNTAFNGDLKKVLSDVRKAMGLPEGDSVVDALIRNKIISEDYDSRYGAANEHELLAEVFTNQKFFDYLKGLDYKGDNMLHRVFLAIAQFFSDKYKALVEAKSKISADNIADYLQQLTESVISKEQTEGREGEALPQLRQSERDVLKNVIEKAIGKISDADIRGKLKQIANLTDPEIDDLLKEVQPPQPKQTSARVLTQQEIGATPEEPTRKSKLRQFQEKYFSRAKGLPDWMLALKDRAKGETHLEVRQALNLVNEVKKEAKRIGFNDWELFDKALRGQYYGSDLADLKALPPEMQVLNVQMRNKIDGLSRDLIINNYVTPEQALNIESNIGEYMTRSYKAFNEKNWGKKVPQQVRDDAFRFLTQEKFNDADPKLTDDEKIAWARSEANKELQSIIDGISDKYTPGKSNVEKGKDLGILKQRKDVPKEIRALLGEYTDPGVNFAMTIARIASLKSSAEYLTNLRQKGLGEIFFEADNRPPEASVQIASEGSETWNPLNGLYTTPEVKEIFKESEYTRNWAVRTWLKTVGAIKWSKTVGSVVTQVKNFESNLGFSLMNGHFQAGKFAESYKFLKDKLFSGEKSTDQMIEKVIRLGLVDQSVGVRELRNMFENDKLDKILANSSTIETSPIKTLSRVAGKGVGYLNKIYGASDDFWKVYGFLNEAESLSQATFNRSYKDLTENEKTSIDTEASERIKNTYPTYDRVWEGAKYVSKNLPIFGNFLSFQAESIRVLLNTFDYAMKDMKVPERRLMAARRLAGIGAYMGARTAILYTISQMTGVGMAGLLGMANDDDKDQKLKDINRYAPDFIRSGDKLAKDEGDGTYTVYDVGNLEPYGIWFKTMNAFQEGNQTVKEGGIGAAATELLSPFIEPEMSFKIGLDLYNNENDFGSRIYNPMDGFGNQMLDAMKYTLQKTKPSTIDFIQRVYSREDKQNEIAAAFGGRGYKVDVPKSFSFKLKAAEELFDANRDQLNKIKFSKEATDDEKNEAQKQYEERTTRIIKMLSEDYHAAIRLGAPMSKLDEAIDRKKFFQGYNKDVKNQIKSGVTEEEQSSGEDIKEWKP